PVSSPVTFSAVAAGGGHTCALAAGGAAYCWGFNLSRQVGDSSESTRVVPVSVAGGASFTTLVTGGAYSCGVRSDSSVACWGYGGFGQLGHGPRDRRRVPAAARSARQLAA